MAAAANLLLPYSPDGNTFGFVDQSGELVIPARSGEYAALPDDLAPQLAKALAGRGISRLYTHQAAAWTSVQAGHHTVVVTPTASGKTLCYNLPVLQAALQSEAKALYMFPTKALAQDQFRSLHRVATEEMVAPLMAEIAALWIDDGTADRVVERKRAEAAAPGGLDAQVTVFDDNIRVDDEAAGYHHGYAALPVVSPDIPCSYVSTHKAHAYSGTEPYHGA